MADGEQGEAAGAAAPPDDVLRAHAAEILQGQDLTQTSMKVVRTLLEERCGLPEGGLGPHKSKVKDIVTAEIAKLQERQGGHEPSEASQPGASEHPGADGAAPGEVGDGAPPAKKQRKQKTELGETKRKQALLFTRSRFMEKAKPFSVKLADVKVSAPPREFSTGSCGYHVNTKVPLEVDGERVMVQCTLNCTVIGSKEWKQGDGED